MKKNLSKLVKKTITDKTGKRTTVWVKMEAVNHDKKGSKDDARYKKLAKEKDARFESAKKEYDKKDASKKETAIDLSHPSIKKIIKNIPVRDIRQFQRYLGEFYGTKDGMYKEDHDGGYSDKELLDATLKYIEEYPEKWGDGDSVDREFVRDFARGIRLASKKGKTKDEVTKDNIKFFFD
jgi:hypothetical protein